MHVERKPVTAAKLTGEKKVGRAVNKFEKGLLKLSKSGREPPEGKNLS